MKKQANTKQIKVDPYFSDKLHLRMSLEVISCVLTIAMNFYRAISDRWFTFCIFGYFKYTFNLYIHIEYMYIFSQGLML